MGVSLKYKLILLLVLLCVLLSAVILIDETTKTTNTKPDLIEINKIKISSESIVNNENISKEDFNDFHINSIYDFTIISILEDNYGDVLYSTKQIIELPLAERINQAISNYDTILDFEKNGMIVGKIIIYSSQALNGNQKLRLVAIIIPFAILCILLILYFLYMRYYLYRPFKRLKSFAKDIAGGNLDIILPMDKDNLFGEFTESFDIMREELKCANQRAINEEKSKKELIAALSHDIKTPISIVRAASELLEINETDPKKLINIIAIQKKTLEIDTLITDLFSSALEDLSELKIDVKDIVSDEIEQIIIGADPLKKVILMNKIPTCLIKVDPLRISQIFGNIISNSYKYADTAIEVTSAIIDHSLKISFKDFGNTLKAEELPMLANKFYRGSNTDGRQGAGLGLYICSNLVLRMEGCLDFLLENDGFRIDVVLLLS